MISAFSAKRARGAREFHGLFLIFCAEFVSFRDFMHIIRMDMIDRRILAVIQNDASFSHAEIADRVNLSASQCSRRLQRLHELGVIKRLVAILDDSKLGLEIEAYVTVTLSTYGRGVAAAFHERMRSHASILECCALTGDSDYLLRVVTENLSELSRLIQDHLLGKDDVAAVRSSIVLEKIKRTTALPL